jgi:hypothetical protein
VLTHPTLDQLGQLGLSGMAQAFAELEASDETDFMGEECRPFFGTPSLATRLMPTPSSIGWFTTPIASISPARASDADALDRSEGIDYQPTTLPKIYCQQSARQPGDIISYRRATSSRNQRATSSESAGHERKGSVEPAAAT